MKKIIVIVLGLVCLCGFAGCTQNDDKALHLGLNATIVEIDASNHILYVTDLGNDEIFGDRCAIDCNEAIGKYNLCYVNYDSEDDVRTIEFDDFQVGDDVIIGLYDGEKENAFNKTAVAAQVQLATQRKEEMYEIPNLSHYKTDYVGDAPNVIHIASGQNYPDGYSYDSIEIQSKTEPYGLTIFLKVEPSASKLEDELQVNADMTFDLISNLDTLDYKIADSKEIIASYER